MTASPDRIAEPRLNALLRRADWRFAVSQKDAPRIVNLTNGADSRALDLLAQDEPISGEADVAVTGFPTRLGLNAACDAVRVGGSVVCLWRFPRAAGASRAAARMRSAGLSDVTVLWPGPNPFHAPQFWLPLNSSAAEADLLARRPPRSFLARGVRAVWRLAARAGLLAPLCAIGRLPEGKEMETQPSPLDDVLPPGTPALLLTGGTRSINKVVALSFARSSRAPTAVVKFSRVEEADAALDREAEVLRAVERHYPAVAGVPRVLATGRHWGRRAVAETVIPGRPLIETLTDDGFAERASQVAGWLTGLVGESALPPQNWWPRLIERPLQVFEHNYGAVAAPGTIERMRQRLDGLGALPETCEHRDCSPWNIVVSGDDEPGLLDWESAEPRGLPGLDLAYFLANAAFVLDGALEGGRTRETYRELLDPATPYGRAARNCVAVYCGHAGIDEDHFARLRLLAWVVHSASDHRHAEMAAGGAPPPEQLQRGTYLGLIECELSLDSRQP